MRSHGKFISRVKYDQYGNILEECNNKGTEIDSGSKCKNYKIQYDEQGNWIKKTEFFGEIEKSKIVRTIEYY